MKDPVGQQLQKAREKAGLSTADVAAAQHLRPSVIQAIESEITARLTVNSF